MVAESLMREVKVVVRSSELSTEGEGGGRGTG